MKNSWAGLALCVFFPLAHFAASADSLRHARREASRYFQQHQKTLSPDVLMMMHHVCQVYALKPPVSAQRSARQKLRLKKEAPLRLYRRLIDAAYILPLRTLDTIANNTDRLVLTALYCDKWHVPSDTMLLLIRRLANEGNPYHVAHALLGLHLATRHQCLSVSDSGYITIKSFLKSKAETLASQNRTSYDRYFELYAFLYLNLNSAAAALPEELINDLLRTQKPNGGWSASADNSTANAHTTLLAYILLCQALSEQPTIPSGHSD